MAETRILVVEDEILVAEHICQSLRKFGYQVCGTANTASAALELIARDSPNLVIMDINLKGGGRDGVDIARGLMDRIPVVFLTAYADHSTLGRAKIAEPYGYITKPFREAELYSTVETALYKYRMERLVRETRNLMRETLSAIDEGVITTDARGGIKYINPAFLALVAPHQLHSTNLKQISEMFEPVEEGDLRKFLGSKKRRRILLRRSGELDPEGLFECAVHPIADDRGSLTGRVLVFRDLRESLAGQRLRSTLASIVEGSDDAIFSANASGIVESCNAGAVRLCGYEESDLVGKPLSRLLPPFHPDRLPNLIDEVVRTETPQHYESLYVCKSGEIVEVSCTVSPVKGLHGGVGGVSVIARDITEKRRLEREILATSERERISLGQDLHDSLGQELTGILLSLRAYESTGMSGSEVKKVVTLMEKTISMTRTIAKNLVPITLDLEGLRGALQELADFTETVYCIPTQLNVQPVSLKVEAAIQLYRIAQEAVTNACRHSRSSRVVIELVREDGELVLRVRDFGIGIEGRTTDGIGLKIMEYRAGIIGGRLEVFQHPAGGVQVICRVPNATGGAEILGGADDTEEKSFFG